MRTPEPAEESSKRAYWLRRWLAPPVFPGDETRTRRAALIHIILLINIVALPLSTLSNLVGGSAPRLLAWTNLMWWLVCLLLLVFLRRGRVAMVSVIYVGLTYLSVTLSLLDIGTIRSPTVAVYALLVIVGGILFDRLGLVITVLASSLSVLGLMWAEQHGRLPPADYSVTVTQWATYTLVFAAGGGITYWTFRALRQALERASLELAERQRAERAAAEALGFNQTIMDAAPAGMLIYRPDGACVQVNAAAGAIVGATAEQLLQQNFHQIASWKTSGLYALALETLETGQKLTRSLALQTSFGKYVWFNATTACFSYAGEPHLLLMLEDITERKLAEDAVHLAEGRNRALIEHAPDGITLLDPEGRFTWASPSAYRIFGYSPEAALGVQALQWVHPEDVPDLHAQFLQLVAGPSRARFTTEYRYLHQDGTYHWVEGAFTNLLDEPGVLAVVNNFRDVTESKLAGEMLRQSQASLEQAQAIARLGSWELDIASGQALYWSHEMYLICQRDPQQGPIDMAGHLERIHPDDRQTARAAADRAIETGEQVAVEYRYCSPGGSLQHFSTTIQPVKDAAGRVVRLAGVTLDITDLKTAQLALQTLNRELEQRVEERTAELTLSREAQAAANLALGKALRTRDEFMAAMSHELRTPLTGILGLTEVLQLNVYGDLNAKQVKAVHSIEKSGRRLLAVISDVLTFTTLQSGKYEVFLVPCSLVPLCHSALKAVEGAAAEKFLQLSFNTTHDLVMLHLDLHCMQQILANLLNNAVKFTPAGGRITLSVTGLADERLVRVSVSDTGIGIQSEDIARLFQPYVQIDARLAREYEGTGLGLALVKALAELQGGQVEVESIYGQGSTFTVILPWESG